MLRLKEAMKLGEMGFHRGRSAHSGRDLWTRHCNEDGSVKAVLCVFDTVTGFDYRVLVANPEQPEKDEQWFSAEDLAEAIRAVQEALVMWKRARRTLEGGFARRLFRKHFTR